MYGTPKTYKLSAIATSPLICLTVKIQIGLVLRQIQCLTFQVTVKVQDNGSPSLSTNCFLNVAIDDENDNSPSFDYTNDYYQTKMLHSVASSRRVYRVYATDGDAGNNGQVSYELHSVGPGCTRCFQVERESGWILRGVLPLEASTEVREPTLFLFCGLYVGLHRRL